MPKGKSPAIAIARLAKALEACDEMGLKLEIVAIGGAIKATDYVYHSGKLQQVTATRTEQGSGPRPTRTWVAWEGSTEIVELHEADHYLVVRSK